MSIQEVVNCDISELWNVYSRFYFMVFGIKGSVDELSVPEFSRCTYFLLACYNRSKVMIPCI